jgi:hypothetical protein
LDLQIPLWKISRLDIFKQIALCKKSMSRDFISAASSLVKFFDSLCSFKGVEFPHGTFIPPH